MRALRPIPVPKYGIAGWKHITIRDCGEDLVSLRENRFSGRVEVRPQYYLSQLPGAINDCLVRATVSEMLLAAASRLPHGLRLVVWDAWRPASVQLALFAGYVEILGHKYPGLSRSELDERAASFVSLPSTDPMRPFPHSTGGAVDLSIISDSGVALEMGTVFDDFTPRANTRYLEEVRAIQGIAPADSQALRNRRLLYTVMTSVGFTSYPYEWWHFDYGDQFWAALSNKDTAIYGALSVPV